MRILKILQYFFLGLLVVSLGNRVVLANLDQPFEYPQKLVFKDDFYTKEFQIKKHPEFFGIYEKYFYKGQELRFASGGTLLDFLPYSFDVERKEVAGINRAGIRDFIRQELIPLYERETQKTRIFRNPDTQKIEFDGVAVNGRKLDVNKLENLIVQALQTKNDLDSIVLPFVDLPAEVIVDDEALKAEGVQELIATGDSDFSTSSWSRMHNIEVGLSRFNGLVIPPGGVFSAVNTIGPVTYRAGFVPELVIKEGKTIPEVGGGLCQVSTTAFRGALLGGFEIVERFAHAYAVHYYVPYGTDATIYPHVKDFKFRNNTSAPIVVQTHIDIPNRKAYFNYFGKKDKREVTLYGPFEVRSDLEILRKGIVSPYRTFNAYWQRVVKTDTGALLTDDIISYYRSPALFH